MLLVEVASLIWAEDSPFGPAFSVHVWSTSWVAINCPRVRLSLGVSRWIRIGK